MALATNIFLSYFPDVAAPKNMRLKVDHDKTYLTMGDKVNISCISESGYPDSNYQISEWTRKKHFMLERKSVLL